MIRGSHNTPDQVSPDQTSLADVSTQSPTERETVSVPGSSTTVFPRSFPMTPLSDVPPRPSTAPPHSANVPLTDLQTRTTLISNLRARILLFQKAISHVDDAVLHLMAARSGIPNSKMQQVRDEARNRKDLLDRVDKAIKMAQEENLGGGDTTAGAGAAVGDERPSMESGPADTRTLSGSVSLVSSIHSLPSDDFSDAPQLRRSSSQPQLGPSTGQSPVPTKVYTLPELFERRKILYESIESWKKIVAELRAAQPALSDAASTTTAPLIYSQSQESSSWTAKYHRAQFEIKRREELLLQLNHAIAQIPALSHTTPEQFAALASYIPPALDKARFDAAYAQFCQGKSIQMNTTIIMPDVSKPVIDVYSLHVAVMQEGSFARVSARKSWDVVGARLGFVQTAATATEQARSSSEIAAHLEKVYMDRLQQFDHLYVSSVVGTVRKRMAEQQKKTVVATV